jgi:hypothetical protein
MPTLLESATRHHAWARVYKREEKPEEAQKLVYEAALEYCAANLSGRAIVAVKEILGDDAARKYREQIKTRRHQVAVEMIR